MSWTWIGIAAAAPVFTASLRVEERRRRRGYAPEWQ